MIWGAAVEKSVQISTVIGNAYFVYEAAETRQESAASICDTLLRVRMLFYMPC